MILDIAIANVRKGCHFVLVVLGFAIPHLASVNTLFADEGNLYQGHALFETKELLAWLTEHHPERELSQFHIHHTWDPRYADFNWGNHVELQMEMHDLHVLGNDWDDIAQHFTLFPDGLWMLGRDLERDPASIRGWNHGAVAVEMVGNFDSGADTMTELQRDAILQMSRFMVKEWGLIPHFHRDHPDAGKTCPGSSIDRSVFMRLIRSACEITPEESFQR